MELLSLNTVVVDLTCTGMKTNPHSMECQIISFNSAAEACLVGLRYKITIHYRLEGWRCLLFYRLNAKLQWAKHERRHTHQACRSRRKHKHTSERRLGDNDHVTGNAGKFGFLSTTITDLDTEAGVSIISQEIFSKQFQGTPPKPTSIHLHMYTYIGHLV